jgi:diamine N-acetyltransferase
MAVTFRDITEENFYNCIKLSVRDDQRFVASNVFSIAQSKIDSKWIIKSIYHNQEIVGFAMYNLDYPNKTLYLCRFMIDKQHQHKGYGRKALDILRDIAVQDDQIERMKLSTNPENKYGIKVYEKFGFVDTGVLDDDEEVFVLDL